MISLTSALIQGEGTAPKDVRVGSYVQLSASGPTASPNFWDLVSTPAGSSAKITTPTALSVTLGPLDVAGVYLCRFFNNFGEAGETRKAISINVSTARSGQVPAPPEFSFRGGGIVNCTFSLPGTTRVGPFPGWTVSDLGGILDKYNGVSRGTIVPTKFTPTGTHAACVGDDVGNAGGMRTEIGTVLSITQRVDLTHVASLSINLKAVDG